MVPADHKWFARVVIGSAIVSALEKLDLKFPKVDAATLDEFKKVRVALANEGEARDCGETGGRWKNSCEETRQSRSPTAKPGAS